MKKTLEPDDALAVRYRAEGWTYQRIATELGYAGPSGAHKAVQRALKATVRDTSSTAVHLELNALDEMAREAWGVLRRDHVVVSQGRVVMIGDEALPDDAPVLAAIKALLEIQARRAKLLGLDAPTKSRVEVITEDVVDAEIRMLEDELKNRSAAGETTAPA